MDLLYDPRVQLILALLLATALTVVLVRRVLHRAARRMHAQAQNPDRHVVAEILHQAVGPVCLLAWYYSLYAVARIVLLSDWVAGDWHGADAFLRRFSNLGVFAAFVWFFHRVTRILDRRLRAISGRTTSRFDDVFFPLLGTALRVTVPIFAVFLLLRLWPLSDAGMAVARKLLAMSLIGAIAWTLRRAVLLVDGAVLGSDSFTAEVTVANRGLFTRVRMLRRVALVLISLFAFAAVLMLFEEVRDVGRSILASAGIAGIILGIAAQRSLGNLLAGIQIAVTQPIRLGDQVLVEGDVGNIEEITLTYVVVRVWDQRRIVLPISYFIEKPFQNWTRVTTNMLSPLALRVDYSLPVDALRTYLQQEIATSEFWDKKVFGIQVTNSDDRSMEVRVLASAPDSGASFNLQCELREKAIGYIRANFPECLPKVRQEQRRLEPDGARTGLTDGHAPLAGRRPADDAARTSEAASAARGTAPRP